MRIFDRYLIMRTIRCMLVIAGLLCLQFADAEESNLGSQPSGLIISDQQVVSGDQYVVFEAIEEPVSNVVAAPAYIQEPVLAVDSNKKEEEPEPSLQPMVIAGSAATLAATGVAVAAVFASPVLFWGALILFAAGAWLTAIGWKKIKAEPKKYKGEKLAVANYLIMGVIAVAASFYSLYILFAV